jgi:hypothetical protein
MAEISAMDSDEAKKLAKEWVGVGNELSVKLMNGYYTSNDKPGCRGILEKVDSSGLTMTADGVSVYIEYKKIADIFNKKEIDEAERKGVAAHVMSMPMSVLEQKGSDLFDGTEGGGSI